MPEEPAPEEEKHLGKPPEKKEVKTLLEWEAPVRVFKKRDRKYFRTVGLLVLVLGVILIFFKELLLIGVVLSLAFVAYALATVPPEHVYHKITTQGITSAGRSYLWGELRDFWFTEKHGTVILNVDTTLRFPARLILLLGDKDRNLVARALSKYLPYREIPKESWMERLADWGARRFNLH